ncbi:unnamed protein product [marine sediment metagenome]|uniref:Uncharacterized protein n=1 Tax=marine sediment metagenome TaxID=412755 RepID=X1UY01_9ZZZZ
MDSPAQWWAVRGLKYSAGTQKGLFTITPDLTLPRISIPIWVPALPCGART